MAPMRGTVQYVCHCGTEVKFFRDDHLPKGEFICSACREADEEMALEIWAQMEEQKAVERQQQLVSREQ